MTKARYLISVKTENNGVPVSRQCFSYKCHVSNIDFHTMMGWSPQCYIPSFVEIGLPVSEKMFFEGFLPYRCVAGILVM